MRAAIKEIVDANTEVDEDQKTAAKHFDGESFPEGQARIIRLRNDIITSLQKDDAGGAGRRDDRDQELGIAPRPVDS